MFVDLRTGEERYITDSDELDHVQVLAAIAHLTEGVDYVIRPAVAAHDKNTQRVSSEWLATLKQSLKESVVEPPNGLSPGIAAQRSHANSQEEEGEASPIVAD